MSAPGANDRAYSFREVLGAELGEIADSRKLRHVQGPKSSEETDPERSEGKDPLARARAMRLLGLAFSGGGIRSATFNLGVLQALAELKLLHRFDYLSTVSGGGYVGGWLAAWIKRRGLDDVAAALRTSRLARPDRAESPAIRFLRDYSNYLTPRKGLFGPDTWTVIGIYLRNLLLNLIILVLAFVALLMTPRVIVWAYEGIAAGAGARLLVFAFLAVSLTLTVVVLNIATISGTDEGGRHERIYGEPWFIQVLGVSPILIAAWLLSAWLSKFGKAPWDQWWKWSLGSALAYLLVWIEGWGVGACKLYEDMRAAQKPPAAASRSTRRQGLREVADRVYASALEFGGRISQEVAYRFGQVIGRKLAGILISACFAGLAAGPLLLLVGGWLRSWDSTTPEQSAIWGMPLVVLVFLFAATLHIGLAGRQFTEEEREWWGRLGASVLLWTLFVTGLTALAYYRELTPARLRVPPWAKTVMGSGWVVTTVLGLLAGKSPATGKGDGKSALELVARIAPYVFSVGLLFSLAVLTRKVLPVLVDAWPLRDACAAGEFCLFELVCIVGLAATAMLLSWRVGVNEFSMHSLYHNRLVRCYLGASNEARRPHPFTGFDRTDDNIAVSDLTTSASRPGDRLYAGPYPIINAALNLVKGEKLAWQQRKAASFVFTPRFTGYDASAVSESEDGRKARLQREGYRPTEGYGRAPGRGPATALSRPPGLALRPAAQNPLTIGTAMAISGAAASPNMGYHSSAPLAFLMTVFNVRLGWWLGNPRHDRCWARPGPGLGLFYLLFELLGSTNDRRGFVYLSDGGHFENLGIYELVKRRCRFIVACDATQDGRFQFGDLGNAVEKCRTDLGIEIQLDAAGIGAPGKTKRQRQHCAVGRIRYGDVDPGAEDGTLLYIKASLTGDEPMDVKSYATQHRGFPHESTADQWFNEDQFEAYRALGHHLTGKIFEPLGDREKLHEKTPEELFAGLVEQWLPPGRPPRARFREWFRFGRNPA